MGKYKFLVDGVAVIVYSESSADFDREEAICSLDSDDILLCLYPDESADFRIDAFDKNNKKPREPYVCFAALSCFFERIRAYPKMTVSVIYDSVYYEVPLYSNSGFLAEKLGKCKTLYTKTVRFADDIEVNVCIVELGEKYAIVSCTDAELFDRGRLLLLWRELYGDGALGMIAVSHNCGISIKSEGGISPAKALALALWSTPLRGRAYMSLSSALIDGEKNDFMYSDGALWLYPKIKYLS